MRKSKGQLLRDLFYVKRSLVGEGVAAFLDQLGKELPLKVHAFSSGERCFDWTIPDEWRLLKGTLVDSKRKILLDAKQNILSVVNYSQSFSGRLSREDLLAHCYSEKSVPNAIPYRTAYYTKTWGFCLPHRTLPRLKDKYYDVEIESQFVPGKLYLGEAVIEGRSDREVILTSYVCHPLQANDGLSGVILLSRLHDLLSRKKLKYTYRLFFIPETIGSLTLLAKRLIDPKNVEYALVATCVGVGQRVNYKKTFLNAHTLDNVVMDVLKRWSKKLKLRYKVREYWPTGSDERQLSSSYVRIPTGSIMRSVYGEYPGYHTSADNLHLVSLPRILETAQIYVDVIQEYEKYEALHIQVKGGEPFLSRHGLYDAVGGKEHPEDQRIRNWILHLADGKHTVKDVSVRSGFPEEVLQRQVDLLASCGLIEYDERKLD